MTNCPTAPWPLTARAILLAGFVLVHAPASAGFEGRGGVPVPARRLVRIRPAPAGPPPVLIRDYLPRNHNVPMYNEPPRGGPIW